MKAEMSCDFLLITRNTLDDEEMVIRKLIDVFPPSSLFQVLDRKKEVSIRTFLNRGRKKNLSLGKMCETKHHLFKREKKCRLSAAFLSS